jgi:hypothetical protein
MSVMTEEKIRLILNERRYGTYSPAQPDDSKKDLFLNAWMMIKASSATGISKISRRFKQKEMEPYLRTLCIRDFPCDDHEGFLLREEEWELFARKLISICTESRGYCSTLFGMVPLKNETVAQKIAEEIVLVTKKYPSALGLYDEMKPFSDVVIRVYCQTVDKGAEYIEAALA